MEKRILYILLAILFCAFAQNSYSQLVVENFEYNAGDPITDHGWIANGNPGINTILVVSPSLEFPCYEGSGLGNACHLNTSGPDAYKLLSNLINTGSAYVSFMANFSSAQTGDYFFHLSDSTGGFNSDIGRVYAKDSSGMLAFGVAKSGNNNEIYTPAIYNYNTTYLILIKYTFVAGVDNDEVSLFVFDDCPPLFEPAPNVGPLNVGNDLPEVGKVTLRQGSSSMAPDLVIDGIYAETSWNNGPLPVELASFSSSVSRNDVTLYWATASETNNRQFEVERKPVSSSTWEMVGSVAGNGTTNSTNEYAFADRGLNSGKFNYRLKQIDYNGNFEYFSLNSEIEITNPADYRLSQNYPNPFNPSTKISFEIPEAGNVSLKVYDQVGREVSTLLNEFKAAGFYSIAFKGNNLASGLYFYKIEVNGFSKILKMTLVK